EAGGAAPATVVAGGINISTAGSWTLSRRQGCWRGRPQDGQLSGNFDDMLAKYEDGSMKLVDFDLTAEINICQGRKAGLAFRVSSSGRFCVFYLSLNAGSSKSSLFFRDVGAMPQSDPRGFSFSRDSLESIGEEADRELMSEIVDPGWHTFRVRAMGDGLTFFFDSALIKHVDVESTGYQPGTVGLWASSSHAKIRAVVVSNLEAVTSVLQDSRRTFEACKRHMEDSIRISKSNELRKRNAARLIQRYTRFNLNLLKIRLKPYEEAEESGCEAETRANSLLTWMAVLNFLNRCETTSRDVDLRAKQNAVYLMQLDQVSPPPPAPPSTDPDHVEDDLQLAYVKAHWEYRRDSEKAGHAILGKEKFDEMRLQANGPAKLGKKLLAQSYLEQASQAPSEAEYQAIVRRAWVLEHDWVSLDEVLKDDPLVVENWVKEVRARAEKSKQPTKSGFAR
ncbi:unnamed protein product, partial [Polarella glacialis]